MDDQVIDLKRLLDIFDIAHTTRNLQPIKELIEQGKLDVNAQLDHEMTPLRCAAIREYLEIVQLLLDSGADFYMQNNDGCTVLHQAILEKSNSVITKLIQAGYDINKYGIKGFTPLAFCICVDFN